MSPVQNVPRAKLATAWAVGYLSVRLGSLISRAVRAWATTVAGRRHRPLLHYRCQIDHGRRRRVWADGSLLAVKRLLSHWIDKGAILSKLRVECVAQVSGPALLAICDERGYAMDRSVPIDVKGTHAQVTDQIRKTIVDQLNRSRLPKLLLTGLLSLGLLGIFAAPGYAYLGQYPYDNTDPSNTYDSYGYTCDASAGSHGTAYGDQGYVELRYSSNCQTAWARFTCTSPNVFFNTCFDYEFKVVRTTDGATIDKYVPID